MTKTDEKTGMVPGIIYHLHPYKVVCGQCKDEDTEFTAENKIHATMILDEFGWKHREGLGWVCQDCIRGTR